jgi:hypothetical protein
MAEDRQASCYDNCTLCGRDVCLAENVFEFDVRADSFERLTRLSFWSQVDSLPGGSVPVDDLVLDF